MYLGTCDCGPAFPRTFSGWLLVKMLAAGFKVNFLL